MAYRINSDSSGKVTGVSYYGPDGSDNTIEADIVVVSTFIYDNTRLLLLSKTDKFPNGLANSSGQVGKGLTAHIMGNVFVAYDDRHLNAYMAPSAQKHSIDDFNADNFDHKDLKFIRGAQISMGTANLQGGPIGFSTVNPPPGIKPWGAEYRDFLATYFTRHGAMVAQTENLPYPDQTIDLDPNVRDAWGLPAPRLTYDWRRPAEQARIEFMLAKMEQIGHAMGAPKVWRGTLSPGIPGAHHEGGTRMGNDPKTSVVNKYGQSWDSPNLFVIGTSNYPTMGAGFNPTLTLQAIAYMSADAIVNHYRKSPGHLI
jgi:gluconate 2-dehydrogenase alpha chain